MPTPPANDMNRFFTDLRNWINQAVQWTRSFWQRVSEGIEVQDLWEQFISEARASYSLYSREVDWDSLRREKDTTRAWKVGRAFFWAMLMKLSPARRVFLLLALLFCFLAFINFRFNIGKEIKLEWGGQFFFLLAAASLILLLALELSDRVTMKRDLEIARQIQRHLVPSEPPKIAGFDIAFATRPANTVAGDYFDAFLRDPNPATPDSHPMIVAVADVAGKGVPAALVMATFQASLRTLTIEPTPLPNLITGLNRYACEHGVGGQRFITAFLAEIDTKTRALTFINAGHNLPVLRRATGEIERLEAGGLPFGIKVDATYQSGSMKLNPGDLLVIFTDGVVEAVNETGEEFDDRRVLELFKDPPPGSASEHLRYLMRAVDGFVGATRQHDDITCLVLQVS